MKKIFYLAILVSIISCKENIPEKPLDSGSPTSKSQEISTAPSTDLKNVDDIKIEYSKVSNKIRLGNMDSTSFKYNCNNEKSGQVTYFSDGGQLKAIRHKYSEYSHFTATKEYFVKDGKLFFVFSNEASWSFVGENQTKDNVTENRIYVIDNLAIRCLQKKMTILSKSGKAEKPIVASDIDINCPPIDSILKQFDLLRSLSNEKSDLKCID